MKRHDHPAIPSTIILRLLAVGLLLPQSVEAQYTAVRLAAKEANAGRTADFGPRSLAVGTEIIALGAARQLHNTTGVEAGAVFLWDIKTGKQRKTIYPPASFANIGARFGEAVAISGQHLVVGAPGADNALASTSDDRGAAFVFDINTGKLLNTIIPGTAGSGYGAAVAMDRGQVAVGAPTDDVFGVNAGNCIVYDLVTKAITSTVPVAPATALTAGDRYGSALAFRNGVLAVGAPLATVSGDAGAGRVYLMDAGVADKVLSEIENPDPTQTVPQSAVGDEFGSEIAFTGNEFMAISAKLDEDPDLAATDTGAVRQYIVSDVAAPQLDSTSYGLATDDLFGLSLAGAPLQLFAGTPGEDTRATDAGSVKSVQRSDFIPSPLVAGDQFGVSVAYNDGTLAALAAGDDTVSADAGAVWMFRSVRVPSLNNYGGFLMAIKGETATGAPQTVHSSFTQLSVPQDSSFDLPSFVGLLTGPGTVGGKTQGFWSWSGAFPTLVKLTGTSNNNALAPGSITNMVENVAGSRWFHGKSLVGKKTALLSNLNGTDGVEMFEGLSVPGGTVKKLFPGKADNLTPTTATLGLYLQPFTYAVGTGGTLSSSDSSLWLTSGAEAREGQAAPLAGFTNGQMPTRVALSGGVPVFTQFITGGGATAVDNVVVVAGATSVLRKNAPAPDATGGNTGTFKAFLGETISSTTGKVLVRATLSGVPTAQNEGLWTNRNGTFFPVFLKGAPAPLLPVGITVKKFISYSITEFDDVLALVQVGGKGVTTANDVVLYHNVANTAEPGTYQILLREGDRISGQDNAKVGVIQMVDYTTATDGSSNSYYGVLATLLNEKGGATSANNLVWLVGNSALGTLDTPSLRLPQVVLRKGVSGEAPVGRNAIASFTIPIKPTDTSGAGNTGLPHAVSAGNRSSSLVVTYPDKSQSVMILADPIEAP